MFTFEHGKWHLWEGNGILLSNESKKKLRVFPTVADAIQFLYREGETLAADLLQDKYERSI